MAADPLAEAPPPRSPLADYALTLPEAHEEFPWGERVIKVRGKIFAFFGHPDGAVGLKLPQSFHEALTEHGAKPAGYNLGKSGWAVVPDGPTHKSRNEAWLRESYRAVAPKRLGALLAPDAAPPGDGPG
jgi:predicted DNA-binding protein (MmcQ/YjbR family)